MKDSMRKITIVIIAIITTIILTLYGKDALNNKANNNAYDVNIQQNDSSINSDSLSLEEAYVTKVIDGDTIWVQINDKDYKVRMIGMNSPEYTKEIEPYGKEATEFTTNMLLNKTIYLQKDVSDTDDYGRLLRYVWMDKVDNITPDTVSKSLFNYIIVEEGLAKSKYYSPDISLQEYLDNAENNAQRNKKGIWE